jgi:hypothetical protein
MWHFEYESLKETWCRFFRVDREDVASVFLDIARTDVQRHSVSELITVET